MELQFDDEPDPKRPPQEDEPVCLISFEVACLRLGAGPKERASFWKVYREELRLNRRTNYQNEHLRICQRALVGLRGKLDTKYYYRSGQLMGEDGTQHLQ